MITIQIHPIVPLIVAWTIIGALIAVSIEPVSKKQQAVIIFIGGPFAWLCVLIIGIVELVAWLWKKLE